MVKPHTPHPSTFSLLTRLSRVLRPQLCTEADMATPHEPTPEQIAERAAEIRAGWSVAEERRHQTGDGRTRVGIIEIAMPVNDHGQPIG